MCQAALLHSCVSTCTALSDLLPTFQYLWVSLKLPAGTSGYMDHLVKETIQTQLHLNSVNQHKDLAQAIHDSQSPGCFNKSHQKALQRKTKNSILQHGLS